MAQDDNFQWSLFTPSECENYSKELPSNLLDEGDIPLVNVSDSEDEIPMVDILDEDEGGIQLVEPTNIEEASDD